MSDDRTREIISSFSQKHSNIKLIDNLKESTVCGLNMGIINSSGSVIIRIDAHCYVESDYIQQCVDTLMRTGADNVGGLMRPVGTNLIGNIIALAMSSLFGIGSGKFHYSEKEVFVDTVYLGAYRREVFYQIGMYDEQLKYSEDDELNYRLIKNGGKIFLNPKIKSHYYCRSSFFPLWRQYYNYGFGKTRTLKKHRRLASWRHLVPSAFVLSTTGSLLLWTVFPFFGWLFFLTLFSYLGLAIITSARIALRNNWKYFLFLPIVFGTIHFSYGIGFLYGIVSIYILHCRVIHWMKKIG